jgi:protein-disulfide isomerase
MSDRVERVLSVVLTVCAVVIVGLLLRREFASDTGPDPFRALDAKPRRVENWNELKASGFVLRSPGAPLSLVVFADLECPACKSLHARLDKLMTEAGTDLEVVLVHFPLSIHRFARSAARAAECAAFSGDIARFVDVAYAKQDSFGLKPWTQYAAEASVQDTVAFALCARDTARVNRIEAGRSLGEAMNLQGTPAIVIDGWYFPRMPNDTQFGEIVKALKRGLPPPGA